MIQTKEEFFLAELGINPKEEIELAYGAKMKITDLLKHYETHHKVRYFKAKYYAKHLESDVVIIIKGKDFVEAKCEYLMKSSIDELVFVSEITE